MGHPKKADEHHIDIDRRIDRITENVRRQAPPFEGEICRTFYSDILNRDGAVKSVIGRIGEIDSAAADCIVARCGGRNVLVGAVRSPVAVVGRRGVFGIKTGESVVVRITAGKSRQQHQNPKEEKT